MFHESASGANLLKFFSQNLIQKINVKIKIKIIIKIKKYITAFCNGACVIHLKFIINLFYTHQLSRGNIFFHQPKLHYLN